MSSSATDSLSPWPPVRETPGGYPASPYESTELEPISSPQSLAQAVKARKAEYVRKKTVRVKIGTWNVASINGTEKDLGAWFVEGKGILGLNENLSGAQLESKKNVPAGKENRQGDGIESVQDQEDRWQKQRSTLPKGDVPALLGNSDIGIYVLGLQEVVDVSSATEALRPYADPATATKWNQAMQEALPMGYQKIAEEQMLGLLILVYASPEVAPTINSVSTTSVGTGLLGYMGNKGAVSVRLVLGETTRLVFVDCHLAAGSDKAALERRNWDAAQVISRTRFDPITDFTGMTEDYGDGIGDEDFGFWFGDLNYRLEDMPGDDVRRLLLLHTQNEYDLNNKSKRKIDSELGYVPANIEVVQHDDDCGEEHPIDPKSDPTSLHTTLQSLLPHDQLRLQQKKRKAFHDGWREGTIDFLPTYKYDVGSVGMFDSGEKKRGPSWCDRILFRTRQDRLRALQQAEQEEEDRRRDEEMKARGIAEASKENDILFDYDPENDGEADGDEYDEAEDTSAEPDIVTTKDGFEDTITIDHYSSHQRVLSSDHKPLDAVFTIQYDAVIPDLRAKVHQEVAKQLDKAENEGRPMITIVVDQHPEDQQAGHTAEDPSDSHSINFGEVRYGVKKCRSATLANTGSVIATLSFIDRPVADGEKTGIAPPWLILDVEKASNNANPNPSALREYSLQPGETVNVELTTDIKSLKTVRRLNEGTYKLDDVLVLRVNNGRDHFIPVHGHWMQSCLCRSIDDLVRLPEGGIRQQQILHSRSQDSDDSQGMNSGTHSKSSDHGSRVSAPRELFALTEGIQELTTRTLAEWDMTHDPSQAPPWIFDNGSYNGWPFADSRKTTFESPDRPSLIAGIFEALDTSEPLKNHFPDDPSSLSRLEALGEALVVFLSSLEDGIIPADSWSEIDERVREYEKTNGSIPQHELQTLILEILSSRPAHSVSFTFLQFMLTRMINEVVPPSSTPTVDRNTTQPGPTRMSTDQEPPETISPTTKAAAMFSSLTLRGRRKRSNTTSSTSSAAAEIPNTATARGLAPFDTERRYSMIKAYSAIFADIIIHSGTPPLREKDRKALSERKRRILEISLQ